MSSELSSDKAPYPEYRDKPVEFLRDVLGFNAWGPDESPTGHPGQVGIAEALCKQKRATVVSCNGAGKTSFAARLAIWFMCTRKNAIVITVAPTWKQVVTLLWSNLREAHRSALKDLPGQPKTYQWGLSPMWFAMGVSTDKEEQFQGFHAATAQRRVDEEGNVIMEGEPGEILVIMDEASGIKPFAFNAIKGYMTQGHAYALYIGNGNNSDGPFYESHQSDNWPSFQIGAFDVPEWIMSREWIEECRADWGEDSVQWQVRVLGQFPSEGSTSQVFSRWVLEGAANKRPIEDTGVHLGLDVARHGGDFNVLTATKNNVVVAVESWQTPDLMETARNTIMLAEHWGLKKGDAHRIHIDIGMGAGVSDRMQEAGWFCDLVDFGAKPVGDYRDIVGNMHFRNRKAELHWAGRQLLIKGKASIPAEFGMTWKQLMWLHYDFEPHSERLFIEPKKQMRTRGIEDSPDFADSWIISLSRASTSSRIWRM